MNILDIAIAKKLAGGGGGSGTDNYNDLSNLPKINDTTLSGNKSSSALGLQSEINSDSKLASDLVDDTNQDNKFVTSTEKNTWNGKQNAIDADHKLSSDLVDDANKTNKFVTSTEKNTWNAKQNAIDADHKLSSDLVDDANKTNKFVTSTEKNTWNAKQNAIDSDHKLSSSLVSFTTAEAAALASGINSSKVGQISTNQTNILYALDNGVKNLLNFATLTNPLSNKCTWTKTDTDIVVTSTADWGNVRYPITLPTGDYVWQVDISDITDQNGKIAISIMNAQTQAIAKTDITTAGTYTVRFHSSGAVLYLTYYPNNSGDNVQNSFKASNNMVVLASVYDGSDSSYDDYALPNSSLTALSIYNNANGVKNLVDPNLFVEGFYVSDSSGNLNSGVGSAYMNFLEIEPNTNYYITPNNGGNWGAWYDNNKQFISGITGYGEKTSPSNAKYIRCTVSYENSDTNYATKFMICLKSVHDVSPSYQPYAKSNSELTSLEAEDRAALAEVVDSGSKNKFDLTLARIKRSNESVETPPTWNNNEATVNGVTFTVRNDMTIRVQSDGTNSNQALLFLNSLTDREAVQSTDWITGCPSSGSSSTFEIRIFNSNGQAIKSEFGDGCNLVAGWYAFAILIRAYQTVDIIFKPMICTKVAWEISQAYVPYKFPTTLANNVLDYGSLNDINYNSFVVCKNGVNDFPSGLTPSSWGFVRTSVYDSNSALQEFTAFSANAIDNGVSFVRVKQGGTWQAWKQTTNT